jgi:Ca-activated chloride channel family protein
LGNALALQGDLQGALSAYEKSLAVLPDAEDAIANRDFIQALLDQQEQESQDQQGDEQDQENDSSQDDNNSKGDNQEQSESSDSESSNQEPGEEADNDSASQETPEPSEGQRQQDPPFADSPQADQEALDAATQEQMAKFDEALEEQQALEQWLRRVPDDPGGLLRRKFRYQTMQRLREGEEPDESIRW